MEVAITRKIDELGRVVLPIDLRKAMGLGVNETVSLSFEDGKIIIKRTRIACNICNSETDVDSDLKVCKDCISKIKKLRD